MIIYVLFEKKNFGGGYLIKGLSEDKEKVKKLLKEEIEILKSNVYLWENVLHHTENMDEGFFECRMEEGEFLELEIQEYQTL